LEEFFELGGVGGGEFLAKGILVDGFGGWLGIVGLLGELGFPEEERVVGIGESLVMFLETGVLELGESVQKVGLDVEIGFGEKSLVEEVFGGGIF
jgi:hypothetical protein